MFRVASTRYPLVETWPIRPPVSCAHRVSQTLEVIHLNAAALGRRPDPEEPAKLSEPSDLHGLGYRQAQSPGQRHHALKVSSIVDVPNAQADPFSSDPRLARLTRLRTSRGWSFPSPMGEVAAVRAAGFEPVGQVFGTTVVLLGSGDSSLPGPPGFGRCFVRDGGSVAGTPTNADPHNPLLAALTEARDRALERVLDECAALGGDGIIGMRLRRTEFFAHTVELTLEGTAVRARASTRPAALFTTHVSGQDLARLLDAGWLPFALVFGTALAACHFDDSMFQQTRRGVGPAGNREVAGYTRLVNDARHEARRTLENAVRERGGHGAVVHEMTLQFSERECPRQFEQHADYVAEATILGSAIIPFDRTVPSARPGPLTIMRLDGRIAPTSRRAGAPEAESEPHTLPSPSLADRAIAYWSSRRRGP